MTPVWAEELKPSAWVPLPAVGSSPETGFQYGAYVMRIFPQTDSNVPQNRLELLLQGTTQGQFQAYIWPNVYLDQGNWQVKGKLGGKYWPSSYFGQGSSRSEDGDKYADTAIEGSITANYRISEKIKLGASVFSEYHSIEDIEEEPSTSILTSEISGASGGQYTGVGITTSYDTRNNIDWPTEGQVVHFQWDVFTSVLASDIQFNTGRLNASQYFSVGSDVFGVSTRLELASENTPFTHLPKPSGDTTLRGANGNKWIDNSALGLQSEYRKTISSKLALVAFADTFQVAGSVSNLDFSELHYSIGGGIRYAMTPDRFNIRLDVGWVDAESVSFAITVGEAF
jgi:outer membrane protein assembly factor BamA